MILRKRTAVKTKQVLKANRLHIYHRLSWGEVACFHTAKALLFSEKTEDFKSLEVLNLPISFSRSVTNTVYV